MVPFFTMFYACMMLGPVVARLRQNWPPANRRSRIFRFRRAA